MRIAYVVNSVEGGGASQPIPAIARVLRDQGAEVRVFALTPRDRRGLPAISDAGLDPLVREGGLKDHFAAMQWLRHEVQAWGATHLWCSLSRAVLLGLLIGPPLKLPVICWQHAAYLKPWNRRLLRLMQSRAALWIGDSRLVTEMTAQRLAVPGERLTCWPIYWADPDLPQASPWHPGTPIRIGSLGRLHPVKGYDVLLAALARLDADGFTPPVPVAVTIGGDGAERTRLEQQAASVGLNTVHFAGFIDDPHAFLAARHLYVQPSRSEGFCIAAHEALAAGLPVIASAVGELPYTIHSGRNGLTVPPGSPDALAQALKSILNDPFRINAMGREARSDMLARFTWDAFAKKGAQIVDRIRSLPA